MLKELLDQLSVYHKTCISFRYIPEIDSTDVRYTIAELNLKIYIYLDGEISLSESEWKPYKIILESTEKKS